jgi:hypothetical protein
MSHFTVVVCIDDPDRLDAVMAPFDEGRKVTPYRSYEDGGPASYWAVKSLREKGGLNPDDATLTWAQVAEAHNRLWDDGDPLLVDDESGRAYTMSTYNPESRWDYWRIGGRWGGYFPYRKGCRRLVIKPERGWDSPDVITPDRCDGGPKSALDLDALREARANEARKTYAEWAELVKGTPEALPWSAFTDNISDGNGYTIERARQEYHSQPRIEAIKGTDFRHYDDPVAEFGKPEALYAEQEKARAVPGYAMITLDGRWMAPGKMGWFGCSTDGEGDRIGYWEAANAYIEAVPDSAYLIALDCHI